MATQAQLFEQVYGILDDWKAQQFGGEPIVEAIEKLTAVSGTAMREELERIVEGLQNLATALERQRATGAAELSAALQALGAQASAEDDSRDPSDAARRKIRHNVAELAKRMGPRLGTGDEPLEIDKPPGTVLSDRDWILPVPLRAGGDASIYGAGLDAVRAITIDRSLATIRRQLPGEVDFTVPSDVQPGTVEVVVALVDQRSLERQVEVDSGPTPRHRPSRRGVKN